MRISDISTNYQPGKQIKRRMQSTASLIFIYLCNHMFSFTACSAQTQTLTDGAGPAAGWKSNYAKCRSWWEPNVWINESCPWPISIGHTSSKISQMSGRLYVYKNVMFSPIDQARQALTLQVQDQGGWGALTDQRHPCHLDVGNRRICDTIRETGGSIQPTRNISNTPALRGILQTLYSYSPGRGGFMTSEREVRLKMLVWAMNLQVIVVTTLVESHAENKDQRPEKEYISIQSVQHSPVNPNSA